MADLHHDLCNIEINRETIDEDFTALHAIIINHLDKHAPIKIRCVKSSQFLIIAYLFTFPEWYSPEIGQARVARDRCKRLKHWTEYKHYRNKTKNLIRNVKRQHFTKSIENFKDTSTLWKHLRAVNNGSTSSGKTLPDELIIEGVHFTDSETIATKFNEYFISIAHIIFAFYKRPATIYKSLFL